MKCQIGLLEYSDAMLYVGHDRWSRSQCGTSELNNTISQRKRTSQSASALPRCPESRQNLREAHRPLPRRHGCLLRNRQKCCQCGTTCTIKYMNMSNILWFRVSVVTRGLFVIYPQGNLSWPPSFGGQSYYV